MDIFNLGVMIAGCCTCLIVTSISFVLSLSLSAIFTSYVFNNENLQTDHV